MTERAPQYVQQVEQLIGATAFYDAAREKAMHNGRLTFTAATAGMRGLLYARGLRLYVDALSADPDHPQRALRTARPEGAARAQRAEAIARELAVINAAEQTLQEADQDLTTGLREHQIPYLQDVITFMNEPPSHVRVPLDDGELFDGYIRGALVEGPTGIGKTVLIARTLTGVGVGKPPITSEHDKKPICALLIVPSQTLVEQMTGKVGDDTLRAFAPGLSVGGYYAHDKQLGTNVVAVTIDTFVKEFRDGKLNGQSFDICVVDEVHHITEPLFKKVLLEHWRGGPIIGFTATPEYHKNKDARRILRKHIFYGGLREYMEREENASILNAAQLFMLRVTRSDYTAREMLKEFERLTPAEIDQWVIREATAEFLEPLIAEGRRGIVFCPQGGGSPSRFALLMAERLAELQRPNGSALITATAGSINKGKQANNPTSNAGIRKRYGCGEIDVITTVDWGREGLNEDIDFVLIAGTHTESLLKLLQMIGRGTRLSEMFPTTVYGHIFLPTVNLRALSLLGVFGLENVEQGVIIGGNKGRQHDVKNAAPTPKELGAIDQTVFSNRIQQLLASIQAKKVGEAMLDPTARAEVPHDYISFTEMLRDVPGSRPMIRRHLRDEKGFATIGRYEDTYIFVIYFEPAANEYLNTFRGAVARIHLQREFGIDETVVAALAEEAGVTAVKWFHTDGKYIPHYRKNDVEKIRKTFAKTPPASPTDYTHVRLSSELGIRDAHIRAKLTAEEHKQITRKRTTTENGKVRVLDHWTAEQGEAIIARIRSLPDISPPYLVPRELAIRWANASREIIERTAELTGLPTEIVRIARTGRPPRCVQWPVLKDVSEQFGTREGAFDIDFSRLPQHEKDRDPDRVAYAQQILQQLDALEPHKPRQPRRNNKSAST